MTALATSGRRTVHRLERAGCAADGERALRMAAAELKHTSNAGGVRFKRPTLPEQIWDERPADWDVFRQPQDPHASHVAHAIHKLS